MAYMISKETENVQSSEEIETAFRAITSEREFVTQEELHANLTREMADYCIRKMKPYVDPRTGQEISGAYDYMEYTRTLFQNFYYLLNLFDFDSFSLILSFFDCFQNFNVIFSLIHFWHLQIILFYFILAL